MKKLLDIFFSLQTAVFVALLFIMAQMWATLGFGTLQQAWGHVYETKWFELLMWILAINLIGMMFKYKTYKRLPIFLLHSSIIVILIGAGITRYFGYEGSLHLRNGESKNFIMVENSKSNPQDVTKKKLGFTVKLDKFVMHKYPGSMMPSSYDSYITIIDKDKTFKYHIYMNHILVYKGYRFYQASYDMDEKGSIISVNHDPGMWVTYFGYLLLAIGFFASMFYSKSRFKATIKNLQKSGLFAILLMLNFTQAKANEVNKLNPQVVNEMSKVLVQQRGRIEPMDTLDLAYIHKITKTSHMYGMNYNELVANMLVHPEIFANKPLIYIGHPTVRKELGIKGKYAPYTIFFDSKGNFKYQNKINKMFRVPDKDRTQYQREWIRLNERVYVASLIFEGSGFKMFPTPKAKLMNYRWFSVTDILQGVKMGLMSPMDARFYINLFQNLLEGVKNGDLAKVKQAHQNIYKLQEMYSKPILPSKSRVKWEIIYNHIQVFPKLIGVYATLGLIAMLLGFIEIIKQKRFRKTEYVILGLGYLGLLVHTLNMLLRWYVSGHAPWSDAYESIIFIAWGSAFASVVFFRKSMLSLGAGLFVAGMFMMVAHLNNIDPQITNMVPVLKSYWLLVHVAVITSSYGFLGVGSMLGLLNMILFVIKDKYNLEKQIKEFNNVIYIALYTGLALLSIGTFLGGIWANESWGRYWSWDPKETWSLITMIVYALVIHTKMIPKMRGEFLFSLLAFLSFFFVLMTYFGVNFYIAQGLHSYGQGVADGYGWINILFAGMGAWFGIAFFTLFGSMLAKISKN